MCAKYSLPPFDWLKLSHHLVSGESTLHEVTLFEARSRIFLSAAGRVLRGSILLPPRHPSAFARMARWQSVECVRFKLIVKEELALTEKQKGRI